MTAVVDINTLPKDEQRAVWDETERHFWQRFDDENGIRHAQSEAQYQTQTSGIKRELDELTDKRAQLTDRQERLSKDLTQVEEELARVVEACDNKVTLLHTLKQDYSKSEQEELERRRQIATTMDSFFRTKQVEGEIVSPRPDRRHFHDIVQNPPKKNHVPNRDAVHAQALQQANELARSIQTFSSGEPEISVLKSNPGNALVDVVDFNGHVIGPVEKIEPWNQWVEAIQNVPVKRQVKIRRGRKFTQDHLATIYDRSEAKGVKWIACMIQATGQVQQQRCQSCNNYQGAFDDCVVLGGPLFLKCGNCEWNRQGCHMPITTKTYSNMRRPCGSTDAQSSRQSETLDFREPPPPRGQDHDHLKDRAYANHESTSGLEPVQLPTPKEYTFSSHSHQYNPQQQYSASRSGFSPANSRGRPPSREIHTPSIQSVERTPQPTAQTEITRSNLVLRHNGVVYTYPECVEGVPLAKIDERHPYWDPRWPSVQSIIAPQLDLWRSKYHEALRKRVYGQGGSAKFQTGRQVNRGIKILEFLEQGDISPYQLLSKKYTRTGKGNITAYDTLFRMCETLGELAKFRLDISPVEWLRHRLHEIIVADGVYFNYFKTMHDFYRDPKLVALRDKNGFKSIGRPSGFKPGHSCGRATNDDAPSMKKRKGVHPQTDTSRPTPSTSHSALVVQGENSRCPIPSRSPPYTADPAHTMVHKCQKTLSPVLAPPNDEFCTSDFTDIDSWSGAPLQSLSWRVYQVKTRLFTSHANATQYWHWKEDKRVFEHHALEDTRPVIWGLLGFPIDFDIPLDDIVQVDWNVDALQVYFVMSSFNSTKSKQDGKPRGDVMAAFRQETTMRRFLGYCQHRRLKLSGTTADDMERRWAEMQSEKLPIADYETSAAPREQLS